MTSYDFLRRTEQGASAAATDRPTYQTLEVVAPQPTLRIRVEHSRTVKDGWSYSTTVELDGVNVGGPGYAFDDIAVEDAVSLLRAALLQVRDLGEQERDARNQRDTAAKEATAIGT